MNAALPFAFLGAVAGSAVGITRKDPGAALPCTAIGAVIGAFAGAILEGINERNMP